MPHPVLDAPGAFASDTADRLFAHLGALLMVSAVAERRSVTGAAEALFKSASAVTRGVAEIEQILGLPLFERGGSGFVLNGYGRVLLARLARIEAEIAAAQADIGRMNGRSGRVHAGALRHMLRSGRKLLLLIHVSDARSVSGAALTQGISQSGVSMSLGRIEETLGVRLFYRSIQGMTPTDAAARLILRARRMRAELRHALSDLASFAGEPVGTAVIGALPLARTEILPRGIGDCVARHPGVQVDAIEAPGETLISRLRAGEIDIVLTVPGRDFDAKGLVAELLFADRLIMVAAADHRLATRAGLLLAEIADEPWILPAAHSVSRDLFERQFLRLGLKPPQPAVQTADLALIRRLLAENGMLAFTSHQLVAAEIGSGTMVCLDVQADRIAREVVMLRREGAMLSPAARTLIEAIGKAARPFGADPGNKSV